MKDIQEDDLESSINQMSRTENSFMEYSFDITAQNQNKSVSLQNPFKVTLQQINEENHSKEDSN